MKESLSLIEWMDGNGASTQIKIPKILKTIHQNLQFDQMSHSLSRRKVRFPQFLIRAIKFSTIPSIIAQKFSEAMQQNFIVIGMTYYNYNIYLNISNHIKGESRTKQTQQQRSPVRYVQGLHMERDVYKRQPLLLPGTAPNSCDILHLYGEGRRVCRPVSYTHLPSFSLWMFCSIKVSPKLLYIYNTKIKLNQLLLSNPS